MISQISDGVFVFVGLSIYVVMKMEQKNNLKEVVL